ncbi:DMSO/TMAO reductase YedYZ, molybdopterin-dependent catalytic subunit [Sphingomonas guangdongensis]|uniref:DMSO/TMAO reductase YedYZ, molybdopterin-dependent catalytic subunit n=1 Tax=Sphingomonas guangdongensis TaxID=1141890 RepID=A0A285QI52_9SPHN|nr:molybdopterin-dependent oxidoreductase [Sphingomonas guangdongensis]SOB79742.1 DMSO/TMAO reductase YedYZ, molybdopterin-dependent catalytic subunit [Sphingomonas guangdongensis]
MILTRRRALVGGLAAGAGGLLAGCDAVQGTDIGRKLLLSGEPATQALQRALIDRTALAPEFSADQRSPIFRANGTRNPNTPTYNASLAQNFADWRIRIDGLVARPVDLSLADLRAMPARTQITRHDCVEGWSAIGKWSGPRLGPILERAGLQQRARYIVFHCADRFGTRPYYESIDLVDAFHPQTILAWVLNDRVLSVPNGAPVRLRVERQLGYKHAKYIERIEAVPSLAGIGGGKGGYWEDVADYEWYAGI